MRKTRMREEIYRFRQEDQTDGLIYHLTGISFCDGSYLINRPASETACIEYILSGRGTVQIDGQIFEPRAGDSYFLQAGKDHLYYSDASEPWTKIWVNVSGPLLDAMVQSYKLENQSFFPQLNSRNSLETILMSAKEAHTDCALNCSISILEILHRMSEALKGEKVGNYAAEEMKRYLDGRVEETVQVRELAAIIGKSESQAIRIFREAYGKTPYAYFIDLKIDLAKKLLQGSRMSIGAISERLNFADAYYFSNVFKKHTGYSPSHYRLQGH